MTAYEILEDDVVTRLAPLAAAGVEVLSMPETIEAYSKPPLDKGRVIVSYIGSDFDDSRGLPKVMDVGATVQEEIIRLELTITSRKLRGANGIHDLRARIQARLLGYRPTHYDKLRLKAFNYFAFTESVWAYKLSFTCVGMVVEQPDEEPIVLTTQITVDQITVSS
jgi:hypothetical protein